MGIGRTNNETDLIITYKDLHIVRDVSGVEEKLINADHGWFPATYYKWAGWY